MKIPFVLIRHVAKLEAPLLALREWTNQEKILQLVAVVTIHGKDQGGHRVAPVTGYISVWCGNFADPAAEPPTVANRDRRKNMKKTLLTILLIAVVLGISSCKRTEIADPPWDGPAGFNILLEGSATPALLIIDGQIHTSEIYVRVTDSKGNPLANETIFFEQLADSTSSQCSLTGVYFEKKYADHLQKVTNANGEVRVTFYGPVQYYSSAMCHPCAHADRRSRLLTTFNVPQDYIAITMVYSGYCSDCRP